jgi:hypothetical protein
VKLVLSAGVLLLTACTLGEITVAMPEDVIVAEVVLREGARLQTAYLHRTVSEQGNARVFDATIVVTDGENGRTLEYAAVSDTICLGDVTDRILSNRGTCYAVMGPADQVRAGVRYTLRIDTRDGRRMEGSTIVPGAFELLQPAGAVNPATGCRLLPSTTLELVWTRSDGAWAYLGEATLLGLVAALRAAGTDVPVPERDQVRLLGVGVGAADTTMLFPRVFGLFDRFDDELHPILLAIRDGLPPGVRAQIAMVAADRNYVNWIRGGNFNPSGQVRLPSVTGDGTGVFGGLVVRRALMDTGLPEAVAACGRE